MSGDTQEAQADLEAALKRCAEVVRECDPGIGREAIEARHKQFDELWGLAVRSVRRVHGTFATQQALSGMGRQDEWGLLKDDFKKGNRGRTGVDQIPKFDKDDGEIPF
jgi:hypothetical protein